MPGPAVVRCLVVPALLLPALARAAAPAPGPPARPDTALYAHPGVEVKASRVRATSGGTSAVGVGLDTARAGPDPTLERVLRQMPLIVVRANSRGEAQPALRGSEDRQIAILVDGVPITLGWDDRADLSVVPLTGARSVTLYRGLPSVLLGPNVLGGAVEVDVARGRRRDTKPRPLTIEAGMDQTGAGSVALAGGVMRESGGTQWVGRAGAGYRGQDGAALAGGLGNGDPATVAKLTSDGDLRLNSDVEAMNGFFSLRRSREGGGWLSLSASGYRLERGVPPESHVSEPRLWRYPLQSRVVSAFSAGSGFFATPWGQGDVEASVGLDVGRTEIDSYDAPDYRNVVATEDDDDRTVTMRLLGDHTLGARGSLRTAFTGADFRHDEVLSPGGPASYRQRLWSLAGETEWRIPVETGGGSPLRVSVGCAADGSDTPVTADKPALGTLWDWGARVGASADLPGGLVAHGALHRRTRFPSLRELYSGALGRFLPNPSLGPEVLLGMEGGLTLAGRAGEGGGVRPELQLVGFLHRLDDAIQRVVVSTPQGNKFQRVNLGEVRSAGVEVLGQLSLGMATLAADVTVQRSYGLDGSGNEVTLEYEPRVTGGARLDLGLRGRLKAGFHARGTSGQEGLHPDLGTFVPVAPAMVVGFGLERSFALASAPFSALDASIAVENLADVVAYDQLGLPQPGRTIRLGVRVR